MVDQLIEALSGIFLLVVSFAALKLKEYLNQKIQSELLQNATTRLTDAALSAVTSVEQSYVSELRKAASDGQLTYEEKQSALSHAVENAKRLLGAQGRVVLAQAFGYGERELERLLQVEIESRLHELKKKGTL
jgi:hypothetical protein